MLCFCCSGSTTDETLAGNFLGEGLKISPGAVEVAATQSIQFSGTNGYPPYSYALVNGGGTLNNGNYTAPTALGLAVVSITDARQNVDYAKVTIVNPPCPLNYIPVPANPALGTNEDFCIAKYEAKCASDTTGLNCSFPPVSQPENQPWVQIAYVNALLACSQLGSRYHLVTRAESITVARNLEAVATNWSSGTVGAGSLNAGHADNSPGQNLAATADDNDACFGTGNTCSGTTFDSQRRTNVLSNGQVIWDFTGNVAEMLLEPVSQANKPYDASDGGPVNPNRYWSQIDTFPAGDSQMWLPAFANGVYFGQGSGYTIIRRGGQRGQWWTNPFHIEFNGDFNSLSSVKGFRCAYR